MMREFGKTNDTTPVVIDAKPLDNPMRRDEEIQAAETNDSMRPFRVEVDEDESNNTAKIIGGVVVGLMIIGGGIYAYEMSSHSTPAQQQVALKTPTQNPAAMDQTAAAPPAPAATPDNSAAPAPVATPAAEPLSPPPSHRVVKSAAKEDTNAVTPAAPQTAEAAPAPSSDPAINAPMTLTPDTAPPPEQSGPAGQTAIAQPLTAPNVSGQSSQPSPSVADNGTAIAAPRTLTPQLQPSAPQTSAPPASQASSIPPGEIPADRAQEPSAQ